jgi:sarcosine oxidase subunit delta
MRIPCPFCGLRDHDEFTYGGDGSRTRPDDEAGLNAWHDYIYLRDNPRGPHVELWQHVHGCRSWLVVSRNTLTHEVIGTRLATEEGDT